jgi:ATP-binding cassette subfamily B multidrug efflux pump
MGFGHGPRRGGMTIEDAVDQRKAISRLVVYLKPYAGAIAGVTLLVILSTLGSLAGPIMVGKAVDLYIIPGDVPGLLRMGVILLGIYLAASGTSIAYSLIMVNISQKLIKNIRADLFNHIQTLSMGFFDQHEAGDLMSRITNDTDAINRVLSNGMVQLISNILQLVGILIAMLALNWQLALGSLVVLPLMAALTMAIASRTRQAFRDVQFNLGKLNANAEENISGVRVVRAFAREKETIDQFRAVNVKNRDAGIKAERITALLMPLIHVMSTVAVAIIAGLGGWLALRDLISIGVIVSFISYSYQFFGPIRQLAQLYNQLQSALAGAERIFYVIDTQPIVADRPGAEPLPRIAGRVEFDHVCFAYQEDKPVLKDVSLVAEPGQTIALVGPTGAGKTTIINLLSRFYDVNEGTIRIDGHDIRDIQQKTLRRQLGIVLQDTYLFTVPTPPTRK